MKTKQFFVLFYTAIFSIAVQAQEWEVSLNSAYVDVGTFNADIGENPNVGISASYSVVNLYVDAYVIAGVEHGFNDSSSEYGIEIGKEWLIRDDLTAHVAVGRWMNYLGEGSGVGDNFVRLGFDYKNLNMNVTVLKGESDTVLVHGSYNFQIGDSFDLATSLSLDTDTGIINPGIAAEFELEQNWIFSIKAVFPEDEDGGERYFSHSLNLTCHW